MKKTLLIALAGIVFNHGASAQSATYSDLTVANLTATYYLDFTNNAANWRVNNAGGSLVFYPQYDYTNRGIYFQSTGDVSFPKTMAIGNVGATGINNMTLAVGGRIGAQGGMHVINFGGAWPDYVFAPAYDLTPLPDVERFIQANHHLPEVPSAAQVQAEGIELASIEAVLLKKVEELTLHLIQLQKETAALRERVQQLEH